MMKSLRFINCVAVAVIAGIWLAGEFVVPLFWLSAAVLLAAGYVLLGLCRYPEKIAWAIMLLFFLVGAVRFIHTDRLPVYSIGHYTGQTITAYGNIHEIPRVTVDGRGKAAVRYLVAVKEVQLPGEQRIAGSGKVIINIYQDRHKAVGNIGEQITVRGEVQQLHGFNNPGLIDTVAALKRSGVAARMKVAAENVEVRPAGQKSWRNTIALLRADVLTGMHQVMPEERAAMLFGMLFGGYEGIAQEVVTAFAATGIVHILSVSGTHIALVAATVYWVCRLLRLGAKAGAFLVTAVIICYAVFAGLTSPVIRSAIMGIVAVGAVALGRQNDACHALTVTAVGMLLFQPALLYDISFQLSFGSTAGLVYLFPRIYASLGFFPVWLAGPLALTLAAQLGVMPFIAWYFNTFSLSSFAANLIVVPLVEFVVVLGLAGILLQTIWSFAGNLILAGCGFLIGIVTVLTKLLAAIPGGVLYLPPFDIIGGLVYYSLLGWLFGFAPRSIPGVMTAAARWPVRSFAIVLSLLAVVWWYQYSPQPVAVHFIDVAQGDATLLITPHGRAVLIDAGGSSGRTAFDIGERVVGPYLRHYGVRSLDYLILTHGHQDHAGGAAAVARKIPVKRILLARENYSPAVQALEQTVQGKGIIPAYAGQRLILDGVALEVLHAVDSKTGKAGNETSNVIKISYGEHSFLITGDLEGEGEAMMLDTGAAVASTVLKVGHHGAKTSTTPGFLQAVDPLYAVISVGAYNRFGHPHPEILQRLSARQIKIYRTDQQGAIVFKTDGRKLSAEAFIR